MFETKEGAPARYLLSDFVRSVHHFLSVIITGGYEQLPDIRQRTGLRLDDGAIELAQKALWEFDQQEQLERALNAVESASDDDLELHGLTGAQLQFKLTAVQIRERRFLRFPVFGTLRRLIQAMDHVLDSVLDAVGASGALKELKDIVFDVTEDDRHP